MLIVRLRDSGGIKMTKIDAEKLIEWIGRTTNESDQAIVDHIREQMVIENSCVCKRCRPDLYSDSVD